MSKVLDKKIFKFILLLIFFSIAVAIVVLMAKKVSAVDSQDRIHFIKNEDGGSDAIVIESNGHCGLIDSMNATTDSSVAPQRFDNNNDALNFDHDNGTKVKNYIQGLGCSYLDFYIMSHNHSDHIGGTIELADLITNDTIVFYKKDVVSYDSNNNIDDFEEGMNWYNNAYYEDAMSLFNSKNAITCDVSASNKLSTGRCYLPNIKNSYITSISEDPNPFSNYDTNMDYTYYFDFGDFKINLYNLYVMSQHRENHNSIVTLVTHKNGGAKAVLMGDLETNRGDLDTPVTVGRSNRMLAPTGDCEECISKGFENQIADIIGEVDILKSGHHGSGTSNSYYMINKFKPKYYITTRLALTYNNNPSPLVDNSAAISYLNRNYGTVSYYTSQSAGAIVTQFSDSSKNIVIKNYNASGSEVNNTLDNIANNIPNKWYSMNNIAGSTEKKWVYVSNNELVTGWQSLSGDWYFFDNTGIMQTGWYNDENDDWYFLCDNQDSCGILGAMLTGFQDLSYASTTHRYYFRTQSNEISSGSQGTMVTGLATINNNTYYFRTAKDDVSTGPKGSMLVDECTVVDGYYYCFGSDGVSTTKKKLVDKPVCNTNLIYNGSSQNLVTPNDTYYSLSNNEQTNHGNYTVTASLKTNYIWSDLSTSNVNIVCSIGKANLTVPNNNITNYSSSYDGNNHSITVLSVTGATTKYSFDESSWSEVKPTYTDVGEHTIYVKYFGDNNHNDSDIYEGTVKITKANLTIPSNSVTNYSGTYDGEEHSISASNINGATIKYSLDGNSWSTTKPAYTNVGEYTIYVKYFGDSNHNDSTIFEKTVSITKANLSIPSNSISNYNGAYDGTAHSITVSNITGATVKYSLDENTWSTTKPTYTNAGEYTIYVKYFGDSNHNNSSSYEATVNISKTNLIIPNNNIINYSGTYDESAHTITVGNVENATIKYSTDNTNWSTTKPTFTNAGTSTIYVKYFGDDNHNNSSSYEGTVSISKANVTLNSNVVNSSIVEETERVILKVSSNVDGVLNLSSSNTSIFTVKNSSINITANTDTDIIVNGVAHGEAQLNLSFIPSNNNYNNYETHKTVTITEVEKIPVSIPTAANKCKSNLVYNGSSQTLTSGSATGYTLSNNAGTNAGSYTITATLEDGYIWSDSTLTNKTFDCSISKANLNTSNVEVTGYTGDYDGSNHTITTTDVEGATTKYSLNNQDWSTTKPVRNTVGDTTVYVKYFGDNNHNDSNIYQTNIVINKASTNLTTSIINSTIHENEELTIFTVSSSVAGTFNISSSDISVFTVKDSTVNVSANQVINVIATGVKAGNKKVNIEFIPTNSNYKNISIEENISVIEPEKIPVNIPTSEGYCKTDLKYNGSSQTITNNPAQGYTFSNNVQTNVGTYTVTAHLSNGYKWSDNSITDKTFDCVINKEDSYLNVDPSIKLAFQDYTISKILPSTNYGLLKSKFSTNGNIITTKLNSDLVYTCDTLTINLDDTSNMFTLIVTGDITKDGTAKDADVTLLFDYLRGRKEISSCQIKAADVKKDEEIHINDVAKLYQFVKGKIEGIND